MLEVLPVPSCPQPLLPQHFAPPAPTTTQASKVPTLIAEAPESSEVSDPSAKTSTGHHALSGFPNESGLDRSSANRWKATGSSGAPADGTPGVNGLGQTVGGQLEMSNVDLATEFTNMILTQRAYSAASKIITTADQLLDEQIQIKR